LWSVLLPNDVAVRNNLWACAGLAVSEVFGMWVEWGSGWSGWMGDRIDSLIIGLAMWRAVCVGMWAVQGNKTEGRSGGTSHETKTFSKPTLSNKHSLPSTTKKIKGKGIITTPFILAFIRQTTVPSQQWHCLLLLPL